MCGCCVNFRLVNHHQEENADVCVSGAGYMELVDRIGPDGGDRESEPRGRNMPSVLTEWMPGNWQGLSHYLCD
jgi:hypothetical protein